MKTIGKTLSIVIIHAIFFCSYSLCQTTEDEDRKLKTFGMGLNFEPDIFSYIYQDVPGQLLFSLNINDILRVEPKFGFSSRSGKDEEDEDENSSSNIIGIGVYGLKYTNKILFSYGFEYVRYTAIREYDYGTPRRWEQIKNGIGPSIGIEYLLGKHFSLGTKFSVIYSKEKLERDEDTSDSIIDGKTESKVWTTIAGLQFRFYF